MHLKQIRSCFLIVHLQNTKEPTKHSVRPQNQLSAREILPLQGVLPNSVTSRPMRRCCLLFVHGVICAYTAMTTCHLLVLCWCNECSFVRQPSFAAQAAYKSRGNWREACAPKEYHALILHPLRPFWLWQGADDGYNRQQPFPATQVRVRDAHDEDDRPTNKRSSRTQALDTGAENRLDMCTYMYSVYAHLHNARTHMQFFVGSCISSYTHTQPRPVILQTRSAFRTTHFLPKPQTSRWRAVKAERSGFQRWESLARLTGEMAVSENVSGSQKNRRSL